jgi:hypothetical protein
VTVAVLIQEATVNGIKLALSDDGKVRVAGDRVTVERWLPRLREAKADIVATLQGATAEFDGRAAIIEFEAGVPRAWAEGFARLATIPAPSGVSLWRWQQVIDDAGRFIDRWAVKAAALGWRTLDVFGVHDRKPSERHDAAGLVWTIRGCEIVAIAEMSARLRASTGAQLTFHRRDPANPEAVAVWELRR